MLVRCDGVDMPSGIQVNLTVGEFNQISIRLPALSEDRFALARLADGKTHVFEWYYKDDNGTLKKYAEAHAKLNFRMATQHPQLNVGTEYVEALGQAWGPPPNYNQILVEQ